MTTQPHPTVTGADVERIVRRDFPADRAVEVLAMLDEYGKEDWQREPDRVRLAALMLAASDIKRLRYEIEGARHGCRDVLGPAEHPGSTNVLERIDLGPQVLERPARARQPVVIGRACEDLEDPDSDTGVYLVTSVLVPVVRKAASHSVWKRATMRAAVEGRVSVRFGQPRSGRRAVTFSLPIRCRPIPNH